MAPFFPGPLQGPLPGRNAAVQLGELSGPRAPLQGRIAGAVLGERLGGQHLLPALLSGFGFAGWAWLAWVSAGFSQALRLASGLDLRWISASA